jgi:hypothetical protein
MTEQKIKGAYSPRKHQAVIHSQLKRFNVLVCHRRFGKTVLVINQLIHKALQCPHKNPQYAYVAPTYGQAKRVAWVMLKEFTAHLPNVTTNEAELRVDIKRGEDFIRIMLLGAENPGSLRGIYLDGCVLDEYAECDPTVWGEVIRPALSDRLGWAIFIGTPKGANHFYEVFKKAKKLKEWFAACYKASETGVVAQSELDAAAEEMSEEEYLQEFECDFGAALVGAYYGEQMRLAEQQKRVTKVGYDPNVPVDTYWDLGVGDSTSIWFCQRVGKEVHLIDYHENSGVGLEHYVRELKLRPYAYGEHWLPHDAAARELGTGKTRQESLLGLGVRGRILPKWKLEDGINAVRMLLPKCWFDEIKCERGIDALKSYQRKWDGKNQIYQNKPLHNWASHGADAFRYLAQGCKDDYNSIKTKELPRMVDYEYDELGR